MDSDCEKFTALLSAYIDNMLSAKDRSGLEKHLEECPECRSLLARMKNLDQLAASAMDNISAPVLDELSNRIMSEIGGHARVERGLHSKEARVIPVWYRYVAVAASIVLVSLIGKMAYDDSLRQSFEPPPARPVMDRQVPEAMEGSGVEPGAEGTKQGEEKTAVHKVSRPISTGQKGMIKPAEPPVLEKRGESEPSEKTAGESEISEEQKQQPDHAVELKAEGEIVSPITEDEIPFRKPQPQQSVTALQESFDQVDTIIGDVVPARRKPATGEPGIDEDGARMKQPSSEAGETYMAAQPEKVLLEKKSEKDEPKYVKDIRKIMERRDNSLEYQYARQFVGAWEGLPEERAKGLGEDEKDNVKAALEVLHGLARAKLEIANAMLRTLNHYIAARAAYDLYHHTGEITYLKQASKYREAALEILYAEKERGNKSRFIVTYQKALEEWDFGK